MNDKTLNIILTSIGKLAKGQDSTLSILKEQNMRLNVLEFIFSNLLVEFKFDNDKIGNILNDAYNCLKNLQETTTNLDKSVSYIKSMVEYNRRSQFQNLDIKEFKES